MNKLLLSLVVVAYMLLSTLEVLAANSSPDLNPCDGPTTKIKILVESSEDSQIYKYSVVNNHNVGIRRFKFGSGFGRELIGDPKNIPIHIRTPQGWKGRHVFAYESKYMAILFNRIDKRQGTIKPGETLNGFELEMRAPNPKMPTLPFRAVDSERKCHWGKVEVKQ